MHSMAYNKANHLKKVRRIIEVYLSIKEGDIPDTDIVRIHFPKHDIFISYRTWVTIKSMKPSEYKEETAQLNLFDAPVSKAG